MIAKLAPEVYSQKAHFVFQAFFCTFLMLIFSKWPVTFYRVYKAGSFFSVRLFVFILF